MAATIIDLLVYTPARDFEQSKRFYSELGFEMTEGWGGTMEYRLGGAAFRLQNYYVKDWAENFMMRFGVEDIPGGMSTQNRSSTPANMATPAAQPQRVLSSPGEA